MNILWCRGNEQIPFTRPSTFFSLGVRGSGKSSFLEHVAMQYLQRNSVILDLYGSRDGEGLAWLRSPHSQAKRILLLKGENVDIQSSYDVQSINSLSLTDLERYDILISASPLYINIDQEFSSTAKVTDLIYQRLSWNRMIFMICREASNFYYSRLKVSDNQVMAKSQMIYLIREARHVGLALGLDSIRFYAIDIDIRNLADYLILKSQGVQGLSRDLNWLYTYFNPSVIRNMQPQHFVIVTRKGSLGLGMFPFHPWHKREKENILTSVGIKVEYGEPMHDSQYRGTYHTVSDSEHGEIIRLYMEEELSLQKIADKLNRSSRTPLNHIRKHNAGITQRGFCSICKRVHSQFSSINVVRLTN